MSNQQLTTCWNSAGVNLESFSTVATFGGTNSGLRADAYGNPASLKSKTVAKSPRIAAVNWKEGSNNVSDVRRERVRAMGEIADEFFAEYKLRLPQSATFAEYAIGHIKRLVGDKMLVDMNEASIIKYQQRTLKRARSSKDCE